MYRLVARQAKGDSHTDRAYLGWPMQAQVGQHRNLTKPHLERPPLCLHPKSIIQTIWGLLNGKKNQNKTNEKFKTFKFSLLCTDNQK